VIFSLPVCRWLYQTKNDVVQRALNFLQLYVETIDDKNINLQIRKHKKHVFHFYKKHLKNMDKKTLNCSMLSSKKHRQYESNKVNNTAKNTRSVQEMEYI